MSSTATKDTVKQAAESNPEGEGVVVLERIGDGITILRLGAADEGMITLTEQRLDSIDRAADQLAQDDTLRGVVVTGPGPGMFAAGADIRMIENVATPQEGAEGAARGRSIFGKLGALKVPVVAAVDGPCLGGALELCLALDYRIAADNAGTQIGLPEVKLGIVPGFGGTQRLTRLVGLPKALDMILQGKILRAKPAWKRGVVDRIVPAEKLLAIAIETVREFADKGSKGPTRKLRGMDRWLTHSPLRAIVERKVRKTLSAGQARFYEAPKRALELCLDAVRLPVERGFEREASVTGDLIVSKTCKGLLNLYFLTERSKRLGKSDDARSIDRALVLGGGVMGAGIAGSMVNKGILVRLCDLLPENLLGAKKRLQKTLDKKLRRRHLKKHEARAVQDRLAVSSEWGLLAQTDMLLEAVPEVLDLKRKIFAEAVERGLSDDAIIATNTSSLSIDAMSEGLPNRERVVGVHFFNPPEKMPLVEVIRGSHTSDAAVATACKLAVRLGKFPVVVKDCAGFLVNRCLAPYMNEAARLMVEGNSPEFIDQVMLDFGFPMGPARLLDEVGYDVANKVSEVLAEAFTDRMTPSPFFAAMVEAGCLGMKKDGGLYDKSGDKAGPGRAVLTALRSTRGGVDRLATRSEVHQRLVYPMIAEAYRILEEGLVNSAEDLDLGLVFGIGFPPFTGGITKYAEREGIDIVVEALTAMAEQHGNRFAPPRSLVEQRD